jgi:hypothetical protein
LFWPILILGYVLMFLGHLWIVVEAWQKGVLWGFGCLLFPVVSLIYVALNWKLVKNAFFLEVGGLIAVSIAESMAR